MNTYHSEIEKLAELVQAWRLRRAGEVQKGDSEDVDAKELDRLIHNALCDRDGNFFTSLRKAVEFSKKIDDVRRQAGRDQAEREGGEALKKWLRQSKRNINPVDALRNAYFSFDPACNPTWREVVELAKDTHQLDPEIGERHLRRLRKEARLEHLPNGRPGRPKSTK
jgi:hypothetical protein